MQRPFVRSHIVLVLVPAIAAMAVALIVAVRARHDCPPSPTVVVTPATVSRGVPPQSDPGGPGEIDELLAAAQQRYVHGDYAGAIEQSRRVLAGSQVPAHRARAWRIVGTSSCFLQHRAGVDEAYAQLEPSGRQLLHYVCGRNGITL